MLTDADRAQIASILEASLTQRYIEPAAASICMVVRRLGPEQRAGVHADLLELAASYDDGYQSSAGAMRARVVAELAESIRSSPENALDPAIGP